MPNKIAIAFSHVTDPQEAAYQAAASVRTQLNAVSPELVVLFACPGYTGSETLDVIHTVLRPHKVVGSSAAGIILSDGVFTRGIAILAVISDEMTFGIAASRAASDGDLRAIGFEWARKLHTDFKGQKHHACLMFTALGMQNNSQFIHGAQEVLGSGFPLLGAVSNRDPKLKKECQFHQKDIFTQNAVGLLVGGSNAAIGTKHGFKPLGKPRAITKVSNNVIHEIDGKPATHIYEEFLGPQAQVSGKGVPSHVSLYPLGIWMEGQGQYLLKNAVDILVDGSIVCQGEVPLGAEVHLMISNRDALKQSATDAAAQVKDGLGGRQAKLIIIIESAARHQILKNSAFVEVRAIKDVLGYTTPIIGMYAPAEIVPLVPGKGISDAYIQNESISILAID